MGITALGFAVAREWGTEGQERRFAVITVGFGLGQALGPVVGGALSDWAGGFALPSALAAAALLVAASRWSARERAPAAQVQLERPSPPERKRSALLTGR